MSNQNKEFLKIGSNSITGNVRAVRFMDGDYWILYIPSLNLSAYGTTYQEAHDMMKDVVIKDFCINVMKSKNKDAIIADLKKLGWLKSRIFQKDLSKSSYIDKEGILREFELPEDTEIKEEAVQIGC